MKQHSRIEGISVHAGQRICWTHNALSVSRNNCGFVQLKSSTSNDTTPAKYIACSSFQKAVFSQRTENIIASFKQDCSLEQRCHHIRRSSLGKRPPRAHDNTIANIAQSERKHKWANVLTNQPNITVDW